MSRSVVLVPVVGPSGSSTKGLELVEESLIVPRLLHRIAHLEQQLEADAAAQPSNPSCESPSFLSSACRYLLSSANNNSSNEQAQRDTETTTAIKLTLRKYDQVNAELVITQQHLEEARANANASAAERHAALQTSEFQRDNLTALLETLQLKHDSLNAQVTLAHEQVQAAEADVEIARAEAKVAKDARATATIYANELRRDLEAAHRDAEEYQRRFLAERAERRRLHEQLEELRGNIRICCRVRPPRNKQQSMAPVVTFPLDATIRIQSNDIRRGTAQEFEFNSVLQSTATQEDVFEQISPLVRSVLDGFNACVLAYGQTGCGKTHTMLGCIENDPGVAPRALEMLFNVAEQEDEEEQQSDHQHRQRRVISVSMLEIYCDTVRDLLAEPTDKDTSPVLDVSALGPLTAEAVAAGAERVPGRIWQRVEDPSDALSALAQGLRTRATSSTLLNAHSSRSHALLSVRVEDPSDALPTAFLHLVDLAAGSWRVGQTEATGRQLKEAQAINKSLAALGDVMAALQSRAQHVPFRNSKLTQTLQDSLCGSSKVMLICCASPDASSLQETLSTLNFASRAKQAELGQARKAVVMPCSPVTATTIMQQQQQQLHPATPNLGAGSKSAGSMGSPAGVALKTPSPLSQRPGSAAAALRALRESN